MKSKAKKGGIYAYLDSIGVLEKSAAEIEQARREYWNMVKRKHKREKKQKEHSFTIWLTEEELFVITEAAKLHELSKTSFLKQAALAYTQKKYLVHGRIQIAEVKQFLALNHTDLLALFDDNRLPYDVGVTVLARMELLEQAVMRQLEHPKLSQG